MDERHLVVACTVPFGDKSISTQILIDYGATGYAFIDEDFATIHSLP